MYAAEHLGFPYLSPYLDSIGTSFRYGANFAIGGSTIRPQNESMSLNGVSPFSLDFQIIQYDNFKARTSYFYNQGFPENCLKTSFLLRYYSPRFRKLYLFCLWFSVKTNSNRSTLPRPEDFSKALYLFDIGQNDIAAGLRKKNDTDFHLSVPDIVEQLAKAVHVSLN